ncbi:hypothetical protein Tco_0751635 [Tanacetum coccineum]|uniref:Cathepsin propeptide inhibitor domain-containing protein n=1 Tax=Tanacetum coccineum TaxID=301880 RepID=A0ABQ4Z4K4_9ASTR
MLRQWVCFHDHERRTVKGSCMGFAYFLQVRCKNQRIDDTTRERRYYEWVAQNYEFDNNRTPLTTTVSDKYPYKTNHSTPIPLDEWDTSFDVKEEYAKEIGNPYSRRFDEYKQVFDNEIEQLSNKYTLRIGKKGCVLDDVWEKCEQYHRKLINSWHDEGFEEDELWRSGDEKTD